VPQRNDLSLESTPDHHWSGVEPVGPTVVIPPVIDGELADLYRVRELVRVHWPALRAIAQQLRWDALQIEARPLVKAGWSPELIQQAHEVTTLYDLLRPLFES
jgi:hypothetical protein